MALDNQIVLEKLTAKFGEAVQADPASLDILAVIADRSIVRELLKFLHEDAELRFSFFTDICGAHYPENQPAQQFGVIYHLHNWQDNIRIRVKTLLPADAPVVDSVADMFLCANWCERETYDFYGIEFKGHPDLRRILNMDEMTSFPLRKEFQMEDPYRTDKDDRYFGRIPQTNNVALN
ncbi:MAG: NADH-quinone oxidoreductase subunit C [Chitinophagales bacterium]